MTVSVVDSQRLCVSAVNTLLNAYGKTMISHPSFLHRLITMFFQTVNYFWSDMKDAFYFEDIEVINRGDDYSYGKILIDIANPYTAIGVFERPVETLILKGLKDRLGYHPLAFHTFKSLIFISVILLSFHLIFIHTESIKSAMLSSILFMATAPTLQSVSWICDFEIVCESRNT